MRPTATDLLLSWEKKLASSAENFDNPGSRSSRGRTRSLRKKRDANSTGAS